MAFEWLNTLMEKLISILPKTMIIDSTEAGVAYWFGKPFAVKPEKLYIYWPIICHMDVRKVVKQCIDCQTQAVLTKDGKTLCVGVVVQYRIINVMRAFTEFDDLDTYIPPLAMSSAQEVIQCHTLEELIKKTDGEHDLVQELTKALKGRLYNSGVEIINVFVNEISPCRALRLVTKSAIVSEVEGSEDG